MFVPVHRMQTINKGYQATNRSGPARDAAHEPFLFPGTKGQSVWSPNTAFQMSKNVLASMRTFSTGDKFLRLELFTSHFHSFHYIFRKLPHEGEERYVLAKGFYIGLFDFAPGLALGRFEARLN